MGNFGIRPPVQEISRTKSFFAFLFVLFILLCYYPYEFNSVYFFFLPKDGATLLVASILLALAYTLIFGKITRLPNIIVVLSFVQWIGYSLCFVNQGIPRSILAHLLLMALYFSLLLFVNSTIGFNAFFTKYNRWILLMAFLGAIAWVLSVFVGFQPFYFVLDNAEKDRLIYNYFLTFSVHDSGTTAMRYSGFFDEPGAMAQWGMFALIINKLFIKERRIEVLMIVCLIFTFSMGFYIQLAAYFFLFYINNKNIKNGFLAIFVTVLLFLAISMTKDTEFGVVYDKTFGRFTEMKLESQSTGSVVAVNDRAYMANLALNEFKKNPLFGTDRGDLYIGDNIYEPFAMYGIVGTFFIYFPFIWLLITAIKNKDRELFCAAIIIMLGFTHRPYHRNLLWNFIIYGIIIMYEQYHRIQVESKC